LLTVEQMVGWVGDAVTLMHRALRAIYLIEWRYQKRADWEPGYYRIPQIFDLTRLPHVSAL
jgi:hypothetical protein